MLYQQLLIGEKPYQAACSNIPGFCKHRHPEIELSYCLKGNYCICINNERYEMTVGDLAIVSSMTSHEFPENKNKDCLGLTIVVGPTFLSGHFDAFSKSVLRNPVISLNEERHNILRELLTETAEINRNTSDFNELLIKGNLYKISAYLLKEFTEENSQIKDFSRAVNVESAMELIRNRYAEQLTVEDAAELTGYSKSNFCKIFKKITGETFHTTLNRYRVRIAGYMLRETMEAIEDIAVKVGFADSKSFCRMFKSITGITPGNYRKNN